MDHSGESLSGVTSDTASSAGTSGKIDRERRIVDMLSGALDLDRAARGRFLDQACAGNGALRAEADELLRQALDAREQALGKDHREVADTLHELGRLTRRAGRADEAHRLFGRALEIRSRVLPPDHSDLEQTVAALASIDAEESR